MGHFASSGHYVRFYEILKMAYTNYKTTLDTNEMKFLVLLKTCLKTLSIVLEMSTINETGRIAEELLVYMRSIVNVDAKSSVKCVLSLLKCLFGTNLSNHLNDINKTISVDRNDHNDHTFYSNIFNYLYEELSKNLSTIKNNFDRVVVGFKKMKKSSSKNVADKVVLMNYIRLFEPMVIKALKSYTITSDVKLQSTVLQLLSNLVQLRVNYCLLDSDQIFIGYVLKQFEFIEEGQIM